MDPPDIDQPENDIAPEQAQHFLAVVQPGNNQGAEQPENNALKKQKPFFNPPTPWPPEFNLDRWWAQLNKYRFIRENEFNLRVGNQIQKWIASLYKTNVAGCGCEPNSMGVKCHDETCLFRCHYIECPPSCGEECVNQRFGRRNMSEALRVESVNYHGKLLVTSEAIQEGTPIVEYVGKVVRGIPKPNQLFSYPVKRFGKNKEIFIDQRKEANESRLIGHSMDSNCKIEEWICGEQIRLLVVAKQNIEPNDPLTITFPQRIEEADRVKPPAKKKKANVTEKDELLAETMFSTTEPEPIPENEGTIKCCMPGCTKRFRTQEEVEEHLPAHKPALLPEPTKPPY